MDRDTPRADLKRIVFACTVASRQQIRTGRTCPPNARRRASIPRPQGPGLRTAITYQSTPVLEIVASHRAANGE